MILNDMGEVFTLLYKAHDVVKKEGWAKGPWLQEPDVMKLLHRPTGYICFVRRSGASGSLCGYVEFKRDHILYDWDYGQDEPPCLSVHGGITFAQPFSLFRKRKKRWAIGFDTAHGFDFMPRLEYVIREAMEFTRLCVAPSELAPPAGRIVDYRDVRFVLENIDRLAQWIERVDETAKWAHDRYKFIAAKKIAPLIKNKVWQRDFEKGYKTLELF